MQKFEFPLMKGALRPFTSLLHKTLPHCTVQSKPTHSQDIVSVLVTTRCDPVFNTNTDQFEPLIVAVRSTISSVLYEYRQRVYGGTELKSTSRRDWLLHTSENIGKFLGHGGRHKDSMEHEFGVHILLSQDPTDLDAFRVYVYYKENQVVCDELVAKITDSVHRLESNLDPQRVIPAGPSLQSTYAAYVLNALDDGSTPIDHLTTQSALSANLCERTIDTLSQIGLVELICSSDGVDVQLTQYAKSLSSMS